MFLSNIWETNTIINDKIKLHLQYWYGECIHDHTGSVRLFITRYEYDTICITVNSTSSPSILMSLLAPPHLLIFNPRLQTRVFATDCMRNSEVLLYFAI